MPPQVIPLKQCQFNNTGVASVIHHLSQVPEFAQFPEPKLRAAAFGFLTAGASTDGNHDFPYQKFHRLYIDLNKPGQPKFRDGLRDLLLQTIMDIITILERASGGATLFIHAHGTRPPHTEPVAEEAKMEVFLPKALAAEEPGVSVACARIIQYYAENVATAAMERWDTASNSASWPGSHTPLRERVYRAATQPVMPRSAGGRYVFYGRRPGELEQMIAEAYPGFEHVFTLPPPLPDARGGLRAPPVAASTPPAVAATPQRIVDDADDEWQEGGYDSDGEVDAAASTKARGKQRASGQEDDDADVLVAMQTRIAELEELNARQELEILGLRSAFKSVLGSNLYTDHLEGISPSAVEYLTRGGSGRGTPRPSARSAGRSASPSTVSSVSSLSASSSAPSTPRRHRVAAPQTPTPTMRPVDGPLITTRPPWFIFGPNSSRALIDYGLPSVTHNVLQDVVNEYKEAEWATRVQQRIQGCSARVAQALVEAVKADLVAGQRRDG